MCLLICIRRPHGPLVLAANRDERYDRTSRPPFVWPGEEPVLAGRDERGGGTWLAVNRAGLVAAVTNRSTLDGENPTRPSRGRLPLLVCQARTARQALDELRAHLEQVRYNGFNLFLADRADAWVLQAPGPAVEAQPVPPGVHVVGNAAWDDDTDPRIARARALLAEADTLDLTGPHAGLFERLAAVCRDHAPQPAGGSLCVHGQIGGTVSSTILALDEQGRLVRYLHAPGPPCRADYQPVEPWEPPGEKRV